MKLPPEMQRAGWKATKTAAITRGMRVRRHSGTEGTVVAVFRPPSHYADQALQFAVLWDTGYRSIVGTQSFELG